MIMYCPQCNTRHEVPKQSKTIPVRLYGEDIICRQEFYVCNKKHTTFTDGKMLNDNLRRARAAYVRKKHIDELSVPGDKRVARFLFKGVAVNTNTWVVGDLVKTVYVFPNKTLTCCHIQEFNVGYDINEEVGYEPTWQSGIDEEVLSETVCQYTGYNDSDGNKIFEYDILRTIKKVGDKEKVDMYTCVYRDGGYFCMKLSNGRLDTLPYYCGAAKEKLLRLEIIGNLFDPNPVY